MKSIVILRFLFLSYIIFHISHSCAQDVEEKEINKEIDQKEEKTVKTTKKGPLFDKLQTRYKDGLISDRDMSIGLYKEGLYFSSLQFLKSYYQKGGKKDPLLEKLTEALLVKAGTEAFGDTSSDVLVKIDSPTVKMILARRLYYGENYKGAREYLKTIPDGHRLAPDAYILRGSMSSLSNDKNQAIADFDKCMTVAGELKSKAKILQLKRYYDTLKELCLINKARIAFKSREYQKALDYYELIPKTSYHWPYILLEMAWSNYYLEDYNRVLGLLVTYKSPLLSSYFFPEAEILQSLTYYKMCLWDDSLKVVDQYYNVYKSRTENLKTMLDKHKDSNTFFYDFIHTDLKKNESKNFFIRSLVIMAKKKVKYQLDRNTFDNAKSEFTRLHTKVTKGPLRTYLLQVVREEAFYRKAKINFFTKKLFFDFLNNIFRYSDELFNIKLDILSAKRHMLYQNVEFSNLRDRGSLNEVKRLRTQYVWTFNGEFWADELGDYSFGLKTTCDVKDKQQVVPDEVNSANSEVTKAEGGVQ